MIKIFKVEGDSMYPLFKEGHRVVCYRYALFFPLHVNDVVIFKQGDKLLIKQVFEVKEEGIYVKGFDAFSQDSRTFGLIKKEQIRYKVLCKF